MTPAGFMTPVIELTMTRPTAGTTTTLRLTEETLTTASSIPAGTFTQDNTHFPAGIHYLVVYISEGCPGLN